MGGVFRVERCFDFWDMLNDDVCDIFSLVREESSVFEHEFLCVSGVLDVCGGDMEWCDDSWLLLLLWLVVHFHILWCSHVCVIFHGEVNVHVCGSWIGFYVSCLCLEGWE